MFSPASRVATALLVVFTLGESVAVRYHRELLRRYSYCQYLLNALVRTSRPNLADHC